MANDAIKCDVFIG